MFRKLESRVALGSELNQCGEAHTNPHAFEAPDTCGRWRQKGKKGIGCGRVRKRSRLAVTVQDGDGMRTSILR